MGLFSWFSITDSESVEGLDNGIPQKTQCYHIVRVSLPFFGWQLIVY